MSNDFEIKDSGKRQEFSTGMVRDTTEDKIDYTLALDGPMFKRLAVHLTKGAKKYAKRNWMKASTQEELERFRESAVRHFIQWLNGEDEEDHAAAVFFNINGVEYVKARLREPTQSAEPTTFISGEAVGLVRRACGPGGVYRGETCPECGVDVGAPAPTGILGSFVKHEVGQEIEVKQPNDSYNGFRGRIISEQGKSKNGYRVWEVELYGIGPVLFSADVLVPIAT